MDVAGRLSNMSTGMGDGSAVPSPPGVPISPGVVLLGEAVSVLRSEWSATVSDTARLAALRALWPQVCALSGHVADRVGDLHVAGAATADGFASTMAFLRRRLRMDTALAARLIRVGADMGYLAAVRVALGEGEISVEHADAIRYVAADLGEQVMAGGELEKILLDYAKVKSPGEVRRLGSFDQGAHGYG